MATANNRKQGNGKAKQAKQATGNGKAKQAKQATGNGKAKQATAAQQVGTGASLLANKPKARIVLLTKHNPRKPGCGTHARYAVLMRYAGKTVETFAAAKGNTTTLRNAIAQGHVKLA